MSLFIFESYVSAQLRNRRHGELSSLRKIEMNLFLKRKRKTTLSSFLDHWAGWTDSSSRQASKLLPPSRASRANEACLLSGKSDVQKVGDKEQRTQKDVFLQVLKDGRTNQRPKVGSNRLV